MRAIASPTSCLGSPGPSSTRIATLSAIRPMRRPGALEYRRLIGSVKALPGKAAAGQAPNDPGLDDPLARHLCQAQGRRNDPGSGDRALLRAVRCNGFRMFDMNVKWPNSARVAVMLTFDFDAETLWTSRDPKTARRPGVLSQAGAGYGADVGVAKILDTLEEAGGPGTFFVPGWTAGSLVCDRHPGGRSLVLRERAWLTAAGAITSRSALAYRPLSRCHAVRRIRPRLVGP
jgi:hypothetical protein